MHVEQIYTGCLAQGAYYITSENEAAIIDPLREIQPYIDRAKRDNVKIRYIFETHFHADFVSGHLDLAKKSGATIIYGPTAQPEFEATIARDNQEFKLGNVTLKALHTPGHTLESTCYLLKDESGKDTAIFTGDTLFLGDVGRPDLAQKANDLTMEDLAGMLYDSLNNKIMPLEDEVTVYPAHGAGSACGKNMMKETVDTLGHQKQMNYALNQPNKQSFIDAVTEGLTAPPAYFPMNVNMNRKGYDSLDQIMVHGMNALTPSEFTSLAEATNAIILDTRDANTFSNGFVPSSINIGLKGDFAPWVGALLKDVKQPILLITEQGKEEESVIRLSRVGFDNILGHLKGGFATWENENKEIDQVKRITAEDFLTHQKTNATIIDVRKESEYSKGHLQNSINHPLDDINNWTSSINPSKPFILHCASGYRSIIAASILKARGINNFKEVKGGYNAIVKAEVVIKA